MKISPRCPACKTLIPSDPPTICPNCSIGIPKEKGRKVMTPRTPRSGFTGSEVFDRSGMALDEYVRRMKKSGFK
jgi:hypothetical protein